MRYYIYYSDLGKLRLSIGHLIIKWSIQLLTWSRYVHCAIGDENVVFNVTMRGAAFWPRTVYEAMFPGLIGYHTFESPRDDALRLPYFQGRVGRPVRCWPTIWRWLKRGKYWTDDCVCMTLVGMLMAGTIPPTRIVSPKNLKEYLDDHGFSFTRIRS